MCPAGTHGAGGQTAGSPVVTACCAAVGTRGQLGDGDTSSAQPPAAPQRRGLRPAHRPPSLAASTEQGCSPILRPHRHHVVLQLLQPCTAVVTAAAGGGQAVVGPVEGGRGGTAVICFKGLMGAVAVGKRGSALPSSPVCSPIPLLHSTHRQAGLEHLCSRDRHPPRGRGTHRGAGAPWGSQTHKELQQLKSAS